MSKYPWTDNPTVSGISQCDTDVLNDCLMHLKYGTTNGLNTFTFISGPVDDNGEAALLKYQETEDIKFVALKAPASYIDGQGGLNVIKNDILLNISDLSNGNYYLLVDETEEEYNLKAAPISIYRDKKEPENPQEGDLWQNLSVAPFLVYEYKDDEWRPTTKTPAGTLEITDDSIDVTSLEYNYGVSATKDGSGSGSGLKIGTMFFSQGFVDTSKGLEIEASGQVVQASSLPAAFVSWVNTSDSLNTDFATTEQNWQAEAALNPDGICGKYVVNRDESNNITSIRFPKYPDWAVQSYDFSANSTVPVVGNGETVGLTDGSSNYGLSFINGEAYDAIVPSTGSYGNLVSAGGSSIPKDQRALNGTRFGVTTDPTKSGLVAQLGSISSSSAKIKGKWYIQIATGQETEVIVENKQEMLSALTLFEPKYSDTPLYDVKYGSAGSLHLKADYPSAYEALLVERNPDVAVGTTVDITDTFSYTKRGLDVKETGDSSITEYSWIVDTASESFTCPQKYPFGLVNANAEIPVIGNGNAPGFINLNDGSSAGKLIGNYSSATFHRLCTQSQTNTNGALIGFDTSVANSGLRANLSSATSDVYLYFCIATVGQNAALANLGRMSEEISLRTTPAQASDAASPASSDAKAIKLGLPASGSTLVASASGTVYGFFKATKTNASIQISSGYRSTRMQCPVANGSFATSLRVGKGTSYNIYYTDIAISESWHGFFFVPNNGSVE